MSILLNYPPHLNAYNKEIRSGYFEIHCGCCGRKMRIHEYDDTRKVVWKRQIRSVTLLRMRCATCDVTHTLIPTFLVPWGRFANHIREFFVRLLLLGIPLPRLAERLSSEASSILSIRTLRRWKKQMKSKWLSWLEHTRKAALSTPGWDNLLLEIYRTEATAAQEAQFLLAYFFGERGEPVPRSGNILDRLHLYLPPPLRG
jgi:hypothetical protein